MGSGAGGKQVHHLKTEGFPGLSAGRSQSPSNCLVWTCDLLGMYPLTGHLSRLLSPLSLLLCWSYFLPGSLPLKYLLYLLFIQQILLEQSLCAKKVLVAITYGLY